MRFNGHFRYLAFLNYRVERQLLEPFLAEGVELHLYNGICYISIVAFLFQNLQIQGIPAPFHQEFEEVNLRFYVKQKTNQVEKTGVVFVREIVPKSLVTAAARIVFNENYVTMPMYHRIEVWENQINTVHYEWKSQRQKNSVRLVFQGNWRIPDENSSESFLTKRPYGFTRQPKGGTREIQMQHADWRVCSATDAVMECDIAGIFGIEFVPYLTLKPASAFVAEGSAVTILG
jgi:uncharacterized protein